MSGGPVCKCNGTLEEKIKNWIVIDYKCNYSAFNGSRRTASDYSLIQCTCCKRHWRTKAEYVREVFINQGSTEKNFI